MLTNDERAVCARLEEWELRIQRILAMYEEDGTVAIELRPAVRSAYATLKLNLRAAFKLGDSREGRSHMSDAERRFYHPAMHAASAHLVARLEASPHAWHQSLCGALAAISDAIVHLNERDQDSPTSPAV